MNHDLAYIHAHHLLRTYIYQLCTAERSYLDHIEEKRDFKLKMAGALKPKPFLGKVISITGAGSGISQCTAQLLYARGATLAICDVNPAGLAETEALLKEIPADGGQQFWAAIVDVSQEDAVSQWIDEAVSKFGRLDHAANICGVIHPVKPLADATKEDFDLVVNVNFRGTWNCMRAQVKHLGRGSSIVNFTSGVGLRAEPGLGLYAATKGGVQTLTSAGAVEWGDKGIRVNAIAPGVVRTTTALKSLPSSFFTPFERATPLGRVAEPEDIAKAVAFLLSEEGGWVNGVVLRVDGGYLHTSH